MNDYSSDQARVLDAILRHDLVAFIEKCFNTVAPGQTFLPNWHIEAIAYYLEECRAGRIKRLIINLPPRNLKSISVSTAYPAWLLGHDPRARIIVASYSAELAHKLSNDTRAVMESASYRRIFPGTRLHPGKNTETEFMTTMMGSRLATSSSWTIP